MLEFRKRHIVEVEITPSYLPELSRPSKNLYIFNYNVNILNGPDSDIQILGKTLFFRDGRRKEICMEYDDVNDEQAWLAAGDSYEYSEFHSMKTSTGNIRGHLLVKVIETQEILEVEIPLTFFRIFKQEEIIRLQSIAR